MQQLNFGFVEECETNPDKVWETVKHEPNPVVGLLIWLGFQLDPMVAKTPAGKHHNALNKGHKISLQTVENTEWRVLKTEDGKQFPSMSVKKKYYLENRNRMQKYMRALAKAFSQRGYNWSMVDHLGRDAGTVINQNFKVKGSHLAYWRAKGNYLD